MQSFMMSLCLAILESLLSKGSKAFSHYLDLKAELEKNEKQASDYKKIINKKTSTREDRRKAEDDILS